MSYIEPLMAKMLRKFEERLVTKLYNRVVELGLCNKGDELFFLETNKVNIRETDEYFVYEIEVNTLKYILALVPKHSIPEII